MDCEYEKGGDENEEDPRPNARHPRRKRKVEEGKKNSHSYPEHNDERNPGIGRPPCKKAPVRRKRCPKNERPPEVQCKKKNKARKPGIDKGSRHVTRKFLKVL